MRLLDSSVVIRFLTRDDPVKAERVKKLILESDEELIFADAAFWETVYALESIYSLSRLEIFGLLIKLLSSRRIDYTDRELLIRALVLYREHAVPFTDAYQVALGRALGAEAIYTYDSHFEKRLKFPGLEP